MALQDHASRGLEHIEGLASDKISGKKFENWLAQGSSQFNESGPKKV